MNKILIGLTSVALMATSALPTLALGGSDIEVENSNKACVENLVVVGASTGYNTANGDDGGDANAKAWKGGTATAGNGGNGGNGGTISTGDAYAKASVGNIVNTNRTKIKATCADCPDVDDVEVENRNRARVGNEVLVGADTGTNEANGDDGGDANAKAWKGGTATAGGGGNGGDGGEITTGSAYAKAKVVNVVNTNITRVRR